MSAISVVPTLALDGPFLPDGQRRQAWVVDGRITYTDPGPPPRLGTVEGVVVPGLVDAHCHIGLGTHGGVAPEVAEEQARTDRDAGVLLIRDAGSPVDTRWIDRRPDLPRLVRAGRHIARTRRYLRDYGVEVEPADLTAQVEVQAGRGDGWVKLVGDWIDREVGDLAPCWPAEVVAAAIARAHELGVRVTAHVFGEEALHDVVQAGIDCVEHGTGLTPELAQAMADRGTALVPTVIQLELFPTYAAAGEERFPAYAATMRDLHRRRFTTLRLAAEAGVSLYAGTDAGGVLPHGLVAREVLALHRDVGLPAARALGAASWSARAWLGRPGLAEGDPADLVVYSADPRDDLGVLAHPTLVVLRGQPVTDAAG